MRKQLLAKRDWRAATPFDSSKSNLSRIQLDDGAFIARHESRLITEHFYVKLSDKHKFPH